MSSCTKDLIFLIATQTRAQHFPTSYLQQVQRQSIVIVRTATEISTCSMDHGGNGKSEEEASLDIHRVVLFWLSLTVVVPVGRYRFRFPGYQELSL